MENEERPSSATNPVTVDQLNSQVTNLRDNPVQDPEVLARAEVSRAKADMTRAQIDDLVDLNKIRREWSPFLQKLLVGVVVFQGLLICSVGLGWLPFTENKVFANSVAGELFLQIAGMGYIVVKCLYPPRRSDAAKLKAKAAKANGKRGKNGPATS